jgi:hypothetical protein
MNTKVFKILDCKDYMEIQPHDCKFYYGIIKDVTLRKSSKSIHCRRCGDKLLDEQVEPSMLRKIKKELEKVRE